MPKVSLIIPVYNVSEYIERCIRSVMAQTYMDIECIIVDDCGTDDSMAKCEQMIHEYEGLIKFLILRHEHNRGLSAARNTGIRQATGKWLFFLDSDDEITPNCIETLLKVGEEDEAIEMVHGNTQTSPEREKAPSDISWQELPSSMNDSETIQHYFFHERKMSIAAWNKLLRRSFIMKNQLLFKKDIIFEDQLWAFYLYTCLSQLRFVTEVTYKYYIRQGSICTGTEAQIRAKNKAVIIQEILSFLPKNREKDVMGRFLNFFLRSINCIHKVPEYKSTFSLYWKTARKYHSRSIQVDLALAYVSSYFKNSDTKFDFLRKIHRLLR